MKTEIFFVPGVALARFIAALAAVLMTSLVGVPAYAQLSRVGNSKPALSTFVRGSDVAYDPQHGVYMACGGQGALYGVFFNTTGDVLSSFPISNTNSNAPYGQFPTCRYSSAINNGNGGFLIAWHQGDPGNQIVLHSLMAVYPNGPITGDTILSDPTEPTWFGKEASIAFSTTSNRFLVVWASLGRALRARLVAPTGVPIGGVVPIASAGAGGASDPDTAWNPQTNEFGIGYTAWNSSQAFIVFRRVAGADASPTGSVSTFGFTGGTYFANVEVNNSNHYVIGWSYGGGANHVEFDESGNMIGSPALMTTRIGDPTSLSLSFNPLSGTVLASGEDLQSLEVAGLELDGTGAPLPGSMALTNGAKNGSFYPKAINRTDAKEWGISYARDFTSITGQIIATSAAGGPPPPTGGVRLVIDSPGNGATVGNPFTLAGWAADTRAQGGSGIDIVHLWAVPKNGAPAEFMSFPAMGLSRPDVAGQLGPQYANAGWAVGFSHLPPGAYTIVVYPHSAVTNDFDYNNVKTVDVTVGPGVVTEIETPGWGANFQNGGVGMSFSGYAVDSSVPTGTGVDFLWVWAINGFTGQATYLGNANLGVNRPDVGSKYGDSRFNSSGWSFSYNGSALSGAPYYIVFYSHSPGQGSANIGRLLGVIIQ